MNDELLRKLYREWLEIGPEYFGDYYPLTPHSLDKDAWIAWQFDRPEAGRGTIQAFRRPDNDFYGGQFRLRGLLPNARYEVENLDQPGTIEMTGRELMETGVEITIRPRPGAACVVYKRVE